MKQHINLYQPEQQKTEHPISARNCSFVLLACFSLLLIFASYNNSQVGEQQQQLRSLEQQRISLKEQFEQLSSEQFVTEVDSQLQQQVEQLAAVVDAAEHREQWLKTQQQQNISWSELLENALSAQTDQVKLTRMDTNGENNSIELQGQTTDSTLIGQFLVAASSNDAIAIGTERLQLNSQSGGFQFQATLSVNPIPPEPTDRLPEDMP